MGATFWITPGCLSRWRMTNVLSKCTLHLYIRWSSEKMVFGFQKGLPGTVISVDDAGDSLYDAASIKTDCSIMLFIIK
jgi:hypothetical protein